MKIAAVPEYLIIAGVLFYPFQTITFPVYGSTFDISIFFILLSAAFVTLRDFTISRSTFLWLLFFFCSQLLIFFIANVTVLHRVMGGLIWFGGLVLIFLSRHLIKYNSDYVIRLIVAALFASAGYCFFSAVVEGLFSRPQAWFSEPSFAGLSFYAASAGFFGQLMLLKMNIRTCINIFLLALVFFLAGLLTLSMHIVAFAVTFALVLTLRVSFKQLPLTIFFIGAFAIAAIFLLELDHFSSRLQVTGNVTNYSTLTWLYGFDQMLAAWRLSPLVGMGLGSTGYFPFESKYADIMSGLNVGVLNVTDAYSALFRMGIELGFPFLVCLLYYLATRYFDFRRFLYLNRIDHLENTGSVVFLFLFSMTMTIGILFKEPTYSRSFVYIAWFLLVTCIPISARSSKSKRY